MDREGYDHIPKGVEVKNKRKHKKHKEKSRKHEYASTDEEFIYFCNKYLKRKTITSQFHGIKEKTKDLFTMSDRYALAHCVGADLRMSRGIAVEFRNRFGCVDQLMAQNQQTGGLAVLEINKRFIYYLVTKTCSYGKPTLKSLFNSLVKMRSHIEENNVKRLAIPRIGCGLDHLDWLQVKTMLHYIFKKHHIQIVVCTL